MMAAPLIDEQTVVIVWEKIAVGQATIVLLMRMVAALMRAQSLNGHTVEMAERRLVIYIGD
jgi:hypothetical protein